MRSNLVDDLAGDILEIGTGTGSTFQHYSSKAKVTAIEPRGDFRTAAIEASKNAQADIHVVPGEGEKLPFEEATFDAVSASLVLCSVASPEKTLEEFKRVLRPRSLSGLSRLSAKANQTHGATTSASC